MIRRQLMNRFNQKKAGAVNSSNSICQWSNNHEFEIDHSHKPRMAVNLQIRVCGCGRWQMNGIRYPHPCCVIYANRELPETYLSKW
jgi:hypothetical protein